MSASPEPGRRATLPALMIALAAAGVAGLGFRSAWQESAVARDQAQRDLDLALGQAVAALREAQDRLRRGAPGVSAVVLDARGRGLRPAEPRAAPPLRVARSADPEGAFYLEQGDRAEAAGDPASAARLREAAIARERHATVRVLARLRLAATARRAGREEESRSQLAAAIAEADGDARRTRDLLLARHLLAPEDADLVDDLVAVLGSSDDALARPMLPPSAAAARRRRDREVSRLRALQRLAPAEPLEGERFLIVGPDLVRIAPGPGDGTTVATLPRPPLPAGVVLLEPGEEGEVGDSVWRRAVATAALAGHRLLARREAAAVRGEGRRRAAWTLAAVGLLLCGGLVATLAVRRALRREREAIAARSAFLAQVGHDLRTPLAVIRMYAETLADPRGVSREESREFAGVMVGEATRLSRLVDTVLDLGRLEARGGRLAGEPVDLRDLVRETLDAHTPLLAEAGVALETRGLEGPVFVRADPGALRGVLGNLIENVLNHAAAGRALAVEVRAGDRTVDLTVRDRGPGIPEGWQGRIFERYVRGPEPRTRGTGLGLALVRETVEAMGGSIAARNAEGGGAAFTVELPRSDPR